MVGREIVDLFPKADVELGDIALEVRNLSRQGSFSDINFSVRKGEILGFCGLMGAQRTEIMQAIFGIDNIDSGTITINGKDIVNKSAKDAIENGFAMVTEDRLRRGAIHSLPVRINLSLAFLKKVCRYGFVMRKRETEHCLDMIEKMQIKIASMEQEIGSLSGGNQQKVILGKWLLTQPDVLILDEPTRGIDVGSKADIYKLIGEMAKMHKAVLVISSELPEVMGISDRILVIREGRIVAEKQRGEFEENTLMAHAFGL
jgi:ABC-type sugar transport system, ATPase component